MTIKFRVEFASAKDGVLFTYEQEMEVQDGDTPTIRFDNVEMAAESLDSLALVLPLNVTTY